MTNKIRYARIHLVVIATQLNSLERYRSGHNEAVLKTVCPKGRVGSNPTLSVFYKAYLIRRVEKYPSG